jgi:small-conductance mechanosensitive channel
MSFREKSAWISILSISLIYGFYFWSVIHKRHAGLLETIIALIIVQTVLTIAVAIFSPKEAKAPQDEREKLIGLKATRFAYAGLATSVALACFFGGFNPPIIFSTNALLFILVVAEIMRSGCQIVQYRRGA